MLAFLLAAALAGQTYEIKVQQHEWVPQPPKRHVVEIPQPPKLLSREKTIEIDLDDFEDSDEVHAIEQGWYEQEWFESRPRRIFRILPWTPMTRSGIQILPGPMWKGKEKTKIKSKVSRSW